MAVTIDGTTGVTSPTVTLEGTGRVNLVSAASGAWTLRFPSSAGTNGQILATDGNGALSWVAAGGNGTVTSVTLDPGTTGLKVNGGTVPVTINTSGTFLLDGVLATQNGGTGTAAVANAAFGVAILDGAGVLPTANGGTGSSTSFTPGSVIFAGLSGTYNENNPRFYWDDAFFRLGIGTNLPTKALTVDGDDALINGITVGRGGAAVLSNTAVGSNALLNNGPATNNTAVGLSALRLTTTGSSNTAVGSGALSSNIVGAQNTAVGASALLNNLTSNNVAVGDSALILASNGQNTAVGSQAMRNYTGDASVGIGYQALKSGSGSSNTSVGRFSMSFNTVTGGSNTSVGMRSGTSISSGSNNSAFGAGALDGTNSGSDNTAIGTAAIYARNGQSFNTAVGSNALYNGSSGSSNTAVGYQSLWSCLSNNNTAVGNNSGYYILNGLNNTILGCYDAQSAPISGNGSNYIVLSDGQGNIGAYWQGLTGTQICSGAVVMKGYTVATLPSPAVIGMRAYVTDASAPAFLTTVTGGGAVKCPVFYDGTNWVAG